MIIGACNQPRRARGMSLVELLVAVALSGVIFCAAWAWFWTMSTAASTTRQRLDIVCRLAFAQRLVAADVRAATLVEPQSGLPTQQTGLRATLPKDGAPDDEVLYVWDARRSVLWRGAPGSYVAEGVTQFAVRYLDSAGAPFAMPADGSSPSGPESAVAAIEVSMTIARGRISVSRIWTVAVGSLR